VAEALDRLMLLARDGTEDEVRACADAGLPADGGAAALWMAATWQRPDVVRILLDAGVRPGAVTRDGATALHAAFQSGFNADGRAVADLLLERGAAIDHANDIARTALHDAAWKANIDVVRFLLDRGARVGLVDFEGKTARELASGRSYNDLCDTFDNRHPPEADYIEVERMLREREA
jgi:ankyrin repeat protein